MVFSITDRWTDNSRLRAVRSAKNIRNTTLCGSHNVKSGKFSLLSRVRTILLLGYWVQGNIHRYWIVLLLGDIFCCSDTQYSTNQTAVSTVHMPVKLSERLFSSACDLYSDRCLDTMLICCCLLNTIIVVIMEFWDFSWSLLCYTLVSVLGISIARGQYYWVLDFGCLSWYRSNLTTKLKTKHALIWIHQD